VCENPVEEYELYGYQHPKAPKGILHTAQWHDEEHEDQGCIPVYIKHTPK
jgi:hypothetical protein